MKQNKGIKEKLIFYILIISFVCFGLLGIIAYRCVGSLMIQQSKEDAMCMAEVAAYEIDGDLLMSITSENDEAYKQVNDMLFKYMESDLIEYIYTMRLDGDSVRFIVDADPEDPASFGEEYNLLADMLLSV